MQLTLESDWEIVEKQIQRSKIFRIPYKNILNVSLTRYILNCIDEDLDSFETISRILRDINIITYINNNKGIKDIILENIRTSVSSRYSEERMRGRIK